MLPGPRLMLTSTVASTWTAGSARIDWQPLQRWWAGAIRSAWLIVACVASGVAIGCIVGPFEYASTIEIAGRAGTVGLFLTGAVVLSVHGWARTSLVMECFALTIATAVTVPALTSMIAASGVPYQDDALIAMDRALGFDWPKIVEWFGARHQLSIFMSHVYSSLLWQPVVLLPVLAFFDPERLRRVLAASTIAMLVTVVIFAFVPARTGYVHLGYTPEQFPGLLANTGWGVADIIESLRAGDRHITLEGLITFPSFHAVAAVLFAYAWSAVPGLRWPFVALNLVMLVSCVPIGSHYVVDVIGGMALALAALQFVSGREPVSPVPRFVPWQQTPEGQLALASLDRAAPARRLA